MAAISTYKNNAYKLNKLKKTKKHFTTFTAIDLQLLQQML